MNNNKSKKVKKKIKVDTFFTSCIIKITSVQRLYRLVGICSRTAADLAIPGERLVAHSQSLLSLHGLSCGRWSVELLDLCVEQLESLCCSYQNQ